MLNVGVTMDLLTAVCENKRDVHKRQNAKNENVFMKRNMMSVKARQRTVEAEGDSLKLPPTYQRGVIPNYLKEPREPMQKKVEECNLDELHNAGVAMDSLTGKPLGTNLRSSENGLPTYEAKEHHKQDVHKRQKARNGTDFMKRNMMYVKARQRTVEAESDPLKLPSTYQRGAIPKYLKKSSRANAKEGRGV
jgi:hypothetical protein